MPGDAERIRAAPPNTRRISPASVASDPVRKRDDIILTPVGYIASIVADGYLLHLLTRSADGHVITYRFKDLEARLDPGHFMRVSRGTLLNVSMIQKITPGSGGTYVTVMQSGAQHQVSLLRGRVLRDELLRL